MIMPISVGVPSATWAARSVGLNLKRGIRQETIWNKVGRACMPVVGRVKGVPFIRFSHEA
ncbi:hypothetical protein [Paenibacillus taichungensis]|uniref:hypothetical protein n=1 Tax=Paenibacillus taichungensis TaxID=484184 RepID=UPI0039A5B9B5